MCGNASRCIGKYVYEAGLTAKRDIALDTLSGIRRLHLDVDADNRVNRVTVDMGVPSDIHPLTLGCEAPAHTGIAVSMGNPHLVLFVDRVMEIDLAAVGPRLEHHPHFPRPGECGVCTGHRRTTHPDACLGTWFRSDPGLWHRCLCHGSCRHRLGLV